MDNCRYLFYWYKTNKAQTVHHFMIFHVLTQVLLSLQNNSIQFHSVTLKPVDSSCVSSVTLPGHRSDIRFVWSFLQSPTCLGKNFHLWCFFQITHAQAVTLPPFPQTTLDAYIQNFPDFQHCIGWGARYFPKNCTVLWRRPEITENYEYCITVG